MRLCVNALTHSLTYSFALCAAKNKYSCAIGTADYIILGQEQIDGLSDYAHEAAATAIDLCIGPPLCGNPGPLLLDYYESLAIVRFGDAFENLQRFGWYGFCNLIPFVLDFFDFAL